jgi:hypothetical protein
MQQLLSSYRGDGDTEPIWIVCWQTKPTIGRLGANRLPRHAPPCCAHFPSAFQNYASIPSTISESLSDLTSVGSQ